MSRPIIHGPGADPEVADLLAAWQSRLRDMQPASDEAAGPDASDEMLAQLHAVADALALPDVPALPGPSGTDEEIALEVVNDALIEADVREGYGDLSTEIRALQSALAASHDRSAAILQANLEANLATMRAQIEMQLADARDMLLDAVRSMTPVAAPASAADDPVALHRAISMLSVLESLDDLVVSLGDRTDEQSLHRLQHFERHARGMAKVVELEEIPTMGIAKPELHEILGRTKDRSVPSGTILTVRQRGYAFRGRVVRPAQVTVAR